MHNICKPRFSSIPAITLRKNSFHPAWFFQNSTINTTPFNVFFIVFLTWAPFTFSYNKNYMSMTILNKSLLTIS